ncbi:competence protein ComFB [Anoxybacterium hadale]|uniref:Competence protein ComFB n=2 Tax=Anoxybacterium hadale TaxID=3408580 RepID=A0ACD1ABU7_9FIRM|nr:competence protein ComFB [Clostridiales bacterium]
MIASEASEPAAAESQLSAAVEKSGRLINLAEVLVKEKIGLVMEKMKVCTCQTCVSDITALTLNSLPAKYVTADKGKQSIQLDTYKKQYETDILAALTKACVRVKASPRHMKK